MKDVSKRMPRKDEVRLTSVHDATSALMMIPISSSERRSVRTFKDAGNSVLTTIYVIVYDTTCRCLATAGVRDIIG